MYRRWNIAVVKGLRLLSLLGSCATERVTVAALERLVIATELIRGCIAVHLTLCLECDPIRFLELERTTTVLIEPCTILYEPIISCLHRERFEQATIIHWLPTESLRFDLNIINSWMFNLHASVTGMVYVLSVEYDVGRHRHVKRVLRVGLRNEWARGSGG